MVAVQIKEPIPTPTLASTPIPPPPIQADSAAGLVAVEAPDDESVLVKMIAMPHIVYATSGIQIEMFEQWAAPVEYFVVDADLDLRLRVAWSALWLEEAYGAGRISMDVYLQSPEGEEFLMVESATTEDFESWGADQRDELLDSTIYLPDVGEYQLRVETTVHVNDESGIEDSRSAIYETRLIALNSPPRLLTTPEDFMPQFGDLEANGSLLDWRGWRFGPCLLRADEMPEVAEALSEACVGFASGDWDATTAALLNALESAQDNPALQSRIYQQIGTLAAEADDWETAQTAFREALNTAQMEDDALEVRIALHNLAVSQFMTKVYDEAEQNLWQAIQISDQIEDWMGSALSYGQFGYYWESPDTLDWVVEVMIDSAMPQAEILEGWAEDFWTQQESE
jgi:tetratricopeptide (TPR) repeat protein